jgi:undecaprenyl-diphosphatase
MIHDLLQDNWRLFELINRSAGHQRLLDPFMILGAQEAIFVLPVLLLALWFVLARWAPLGRRMAARSSATGERARLEYDRGLGQRMALLGGAGVVLALGLNGLLGHLVFEPRPFVSHPTVVHQLISHAADDAFPSDHAAVAGAVTTVFGLYLLLVLTSAVRLRAEHMRGETLQAVRMALVVRRRFVPVVGVALVLFATSLAVLLWLGIARVYTGVHYPADILVGTLCGFVGSVVATALRPLVEPLLGPVLRFAEWVHAA